MINRHNSYYVKNLLLCLLHKQLNIFIMELLNVIHPKDFQSNLECPEVSLMLGLKVAVFVVNYKGRFPIHVENVTLSDNVLTIEI